MQKCAHRTSSNIVVAEKIINAYALPGVNELIVWNKPDW